MKFYHIEIATNKIIDEFVPRIPDATANNEDITIPRICVCPSIKDCLNAVPWGRLTFAEGYPICTILRVYVFEENDYISNQELISKNLVPDAKYTNEYWLIKKSKPIYDFLIMNVDGDMKTLNLENGKTFTYYENIYYDECLDNFGNCFDNQYIISLKDFDRKDLNKDLFELACHSVLQVYFDSGFGENIYNAKIENDILSFNSYLLVSKQEFKKRLKNEIDTRQLIEDII